PISAKAQDGLAPHVLQLEQVLQRHREFDVIHFHTSSIHFPVCRRISTPTVTTLHGRLDIPELGPLFAEFDDQPLVSISDAQRAPVMHARFEATVYHGLPADLFRLGDGRGGYLAFTGRISPEKQPDVAIRIAREAGMPIRIAAKVDAVDQAYFHAVVEPLLREPGVEFIGEIDDRQKQELLGGAAALLFPIDWPEPFGLVMIEAMACGTPVIAFDRGSVPEVIDHGVTGFIVTDLEDAVKAAEQVDRIDRRRCRQVLEERFTVRRMAQDYVRAYHALTGAGEPEDDESAVLVVDNGRRR